MNTPGTGKAFLADLHEALRSYDRDDVLAELARLTDLQVAQAQQRARLALGLGRAVRAVLDAALERLAQRDRQAADLLVRHFVRGESTAHLARAYDCSERTLFTRQRQALIALAQVIWEAEDAARLSGPLSEIQQAALASLPPPSFSRLFGVGEHLTRLKDFLRSERGCPLVDARSFDLALRCAEDATALAVVIGDPIKEADALTNAARALMALEDVGEAERRLARALALAQAAGATVFTAKAHLFLGHAACADGRWALALERFERALPLVAGYHDEVGRATVLSNIGRALTGLGRWDEATVTLEEAIRVLQHHGNGPAEAVARQRLENAQARRSQVSS